MSTLQTEAAKTHGSTIETVDPQTVKQWLDAGEAMVIDVREPGEFRGERIAGAVNVPLSRFDAAALPENGNHKLVIHCKSGGRAKQACGKLTDARVDCVIYNMGGIEAWKSAGLPTAKSEGGVIDIVRQVHIVVGTLVLAGSILAATVSPWFLLLTGFFGVGLLFAGATGFCGMAMMLAKMPWNR